MKVVDFVRECLVVKGLWRKNAVFVALACLLLSNSAHAELVASVLPSSRSATVGTPVTVFATIINAATAAADNHKQLPGVAADLSAHNCRIALAADFPLDFTFQQTDPATNTTIGAPDTPITIAANAAASFVLTLTPYAEIPPTHVGFDFICAGLAPARLLYGVNTLALSANFNPVADVIALSASSAGGGVAILKSAVNPAITCSQQSADDVPSICEIGAFSLAAVNVGRADDSLFLRASTLTGAQLSVCATDALTGECAAVPNARQVGVDLQSGAAGTYSVFVTTSDKLAFDPANSRVNVEFVDSQGELRGATSIALASKPDEWFAWRDLANGVSTLRVTGDVVAGTPCHEAVAEIASAQDPASDYLTLNVQLVSTLTAGQACVQATAHVPLTYALPNYLAAYRGLVIRTPNGGSEIVEIHESL